jgi:hypothetical protein
VRVRFARDFAQFLNHVRRRRQIGIAHAKVDYVLAPRPRGGPHRVDFGDDIGRQTLDTVELFGHGRFHNRC